MNWKRWSIVGGLALFLLLAGSGTARAAEFVGEDIYRLPAGDVVDDDLYVSANEIYIDGTVNGDLIAVGGIIEVNGVVTGDALLAGGGITINGEIQDDLRAAGAGIEINGTIGDDLIAAGGGNAAFGAAGQGIPFSDSFPMGNQTVVQGLRLNGTVGGDALLAGGTADIGGTIGGDVRGGLGEAVLTGTIGGDVELGVGTLQVRDGATVAGTLKYETDAEAAIPAGTAGGVEFTQTEQPATEGGSGFLGSVIGWVLRTIALVIGFAALGWLLLRVRPGWITAPAAALSAEPGKSAGFGCLAALGFIFLPILSGLLVFLVALFWGGWQAVVLFFFLFSALALVWIFSPLVTGYWIGQRFNSSPLVALLIGTLLIVLIGRIPILGWFIYLVSFVLALGGIVAARAQSAEALPPSKVTPAI